MISTAVVPLEEQDFQFKLHCKLRVFNESKKSPAKIFHKIAASSLYGLLFIGTSYQEFQVVQLHDVLENLSKGEQRQYPRRTINLPSEPTHIALSAENNYLAVIVTKYDCATALIYDTASFKSENVQICHEIRLSATPKVFTLDMSWNPGMNNLFSVCMSDGSIGIYEVKPNSFELNLLPTNSESRCLCWSPKGKQIVIGSAKGVLSQYKPDLKLVKTYPAPPLNNSNNISMINVLWITNYQFIGIYQDMQDSNGCPVLIIVNTSKAGPTTYVNYEDICYSSGTSRPTKFFFIYQPIWNILMVASANSMEVGVLGGMEGNVGVWQQWIQSDESRAELPLSGAKEETYPIGFALYTGSTHQLPWGENQFLPPMPVLCILSHEGVLNVFNVINTRKDTPLICQPPKTIQDQSGRYLFTIPTSVPPQLQMAQMFENKSTSSMTNAINIPQPAINIPQPNVFAAPETKPANMSMFGGVALTQLGTKNETFSSGAGESFKLTEFTDEKKSVKLPTTPPMTITKSFNQVEQPKSDSIQINELTQPSEQPEIDNAELMSLISTDMQTFQAELKLLLTSSKQVDITVGSEEEKNYIVEKSQNLADFFKELQETTETLRVEIHALKQMLIEGFALREEANSRYDVNSSSMQFVPIFKVREVDPITNKQVSEIKRLFYYVESQLKQVNQFLDDEWYNFQDSCRESVRQSMRTPTLEIIYQTILKQYEIIERHKVFIKNIQEKIRIYTSKQPNLHSKLLISKLGDQISDLQITHIENDAFLSKYNKIHETNKKFTAFKEEKLRAFLLSQKITRITPCKPNNSKLISSILLKSPTNLNTTSSSCKISRVPAYKNLPLLTTPTASLYPSTTETTKPEEVLIKPSVSKKLSDYYEDVTPPPTPGTSIPKQPPEDLKKEKPIEKNKTPTLIGLLTAKPTSADKNTLNDLNYSNPTNEDFKHVQSPVVTIKTTASTTESTNTIQISTPSFTMLNFNNKLLNERPSTKIPSENLQSIVKPSIFAPTESAEICTDSDPKINLFTGPSSVFKTPTTITSTKSIFAGNENTTVTTSTNELQTPTTITPNVTQISHKTIPTPTSTSLFQMNTQKTSPNTSNNFTTNTTRTGFVAITSSTNIFSSKTTTSLPLQLPSQPTPVMKLSTFATVSNTTENKITIADRTDQSHVSAALPLLANPPATVSPSTVATASSFSFTSPEQTTKSIFGGFQTTPTTQNLNTATTISTPTSLTPVSTTTTTTTSISTPHSSQFGTEKTFGFGNLIVSSPMTSTNTSSNNTSFSFGNLTVSALSPQSTNINPPVPITSSSTAFRFVASTAAVPATTNNSFSFRQSIFGGQTATTSVTESSFMNKQICSPSVFGGQNTQQPQSQQSSSIFGGGQNTPNTNLFTQQPTENITSIFGQGKPVTPAFGSPSAANTQSVTDTRSIFAKSVASTSPFTQQSGSIFGAKSNFGQTASFGQPATFGSPSNNIFGGGSGPAFASNSPSTNLFNSTPPTGFGSASPGQTGAFSSGGQSISQSGFGAPAVFQKPVSTFGQAPAFGATGGFGAPPTFGGNPTFNSPQKVFGDTSINQQATSTSFSAIQQNSTFANLASQNTVGFGNLAQGQGPQQPAQAPQFSGGSSFSSWR